MTTSTIGIIICIIFACFLIGTGNKNANKASQQSVKHRLDENYNEARNQDKIENYNESKKAIGIAILIVLIVLLLIYKINLL